MWLFGDPPDKRRFAAQMDTTGMSHKLETKPAVLRADFIRNPEVPWCKKLFKQEEQDTTYERRGQTQNRTEGGLLVKQRPDRDAKMDAADHFPQQRGDAEDRHVGQALFLRDRMRVGNDQLGEGGFSQPLDRRRG